MNTDPEPFTGSVAGWIALVGFVVMLAFVAGWVFRSFTAMVLLLAAVFSIAVVLAIVERSAKK